MTTPNIPNITLPALTEVNITDITNGNVNGEGVFDKLMCAVRAQLKCMVDSNIISQTDMSTVVSSTIAETLKTSIELTFQRERQSYDLRILNAQLEGINKDNTIKEYQLNQMMPAQYDQVLAQTATTLSQKAVIDYELANKLPVEVANLTKQGDSITSQTNLTNAQIDIAEYQLSDKLPADTALVEQQTINLGSEKLLTDARILTEGKQQLAIDATILSTEAQTDLYTQKAITEKAQTDPAPILTGSVIDRQNAVLVAQKDAFLTDAQQKTAKLLIDTWSVRYQEDSVGAAVGDFNKLHDKNVGEAVSKLMVGAGMTPQPFTP